MIMCSGRGRATSVLLLLLWLWQSQSSAASVYACQEDADCDRLLGFGSICLLDSGISICNNPFASGCLSALLPNDTSVLKRVCNSADTPDAAASGLCRPPPIDYPEVRLYAPNWETPIFESWILQIVLSELMGVPTTAETGEPSTSIQMNFYHPTPTFEYGPSTVTQQGALATAHSLGGDCVPASASDAEGAYVPCAHAVLESWESNLGWIREYVYNGTIEQPRPLGVLGQESWYITQFTAVNDTTLTSYLGLQGETNRRKLAETFLRPTTWKDYCEQVSDNNCTTPDSVAQRGPQDETDEQRMFVEGLYTGHFRATSENDCDRYPLNCTGHIADYPCGWSSYVEPQTHHLNIALSSSGQETGSKGYTYSQLTEMWKAANATKSNLMMFWWTTEPLYQSFVGTEAEFQKVLLPTPTQECIQARLTPIDRCSEVWEERIGQAAGSCDETPNPLQKLISKGLHDVIYHPSIPEPIRSPAWEIINAFSISELQLGEMFQYWQTKRSPREAICQWAVENIETLQTWQPRQYPRVLQEQPTSQQNIIYASLALGGLATLLVIITAALVYKHRLRRAIRFAQVEFLFILLAGLLSVAVGAVVFGLKTSDGSCIAGTWLVNLGYTAELVPLMVKVAAINRLNAAANKMKRVVLTRSGLFRTVFSICMVVVVFLVVWTIVDPPSKTAEYDLSTEDEDGNTVVAVSYYCSSESNVWRSCALGWNCILLLCSAVLAFQTRKTQRSLNESQVLALMIYSHLMFIVLRGVTLFLSGSISEALLGRMRSIIFSCDTIATLVIYFVPKFFDLNPDAAMSHGRRSSLWEANAAISRHSRLSFIEDPNLEHRKAMPDLNKNEPDCERPPEESMPNLNKNEPDCERPPEESPDTNTGTDEPCPHCGRTAELPLRQRNGNHSPVESFCGASDISAAS